jgi:hypothetical protein
LLLLSLPSDSALVLHLLHALLHAALLIGVCIRHLWLVAIARELLLRRMVVLLNTIEVAMEVLNWHTAIYWLLRLLSRAASTTGVSSFHASLLCFVMLLCEEVSAASDDCETEETHGVLLVKVVFCRVEDVCLVA